MQKVQSTSSQPALVEKKDTTQQSMPVPTSPFRTVFQTTDGMKQEFVNFLTTIFYQLDDKKVLAAMETILADPNKTDEDIYNELVSKIDGLQKRFPLLHQIKALRVLKQGMGAQAADLLSGYNKKAFKDYAEIYFARYLDSFRKYAGLPLNGTALRIADKAQVTFQDRIEAGKFRYPYNKFEPLNDDDCTDPAMQPEKTHKPLESSVADESLDLIGCLGGLHHAPEERVIPFVKSLYVKLRPGGVLLVRDHDVTTPELSAMVSVVHSFVNAAAKVPVNVEQKEIRKWTSIEDWTEILENCGFQRILKDPLVLPKDPTQNGMIAFVKTPKNLEELRSAMQYIPDATCHAGRSYSTWIEWGNVRFAKQYAAFIQDHHAYAFDYIGHLRQHWTHFAEYVKACRHDQIGLREMLFSDGFTMNLFILFTATIQCAVGKVMNIPSQALAYWKHGESWREVAHLSCLEKYQAQVENDYCNFIDETPFYMFPFVAKIPGIWKAVFAESTWGGKLASIPGGISSTAEFLVKSAISLPVRLVFTSEANKAPDTVKILIDDYNEVSDKVIDTWNLQNPKYPVKVLYTTEDGHRALSVPRYRPFTTFCQKLAETNRVELIEVAGQKNISIDLLMSKEDDSMNPLKDGLAYTLDVLQGKKKGMEYRTYKLTAENLFSALRRTDTVDYIHE